jgi:hypothetical protein
MSAQVAEEESDVGEPWIPEGIYPEEESDVGEPWIPEGIYFVDVGDLVAQVGEEDEKQWNIEPDRNVGERWITEGTSVEWGETVEAKDEDEDEPLGSEGHEPFVCWPLTWGEDCGEPFMSYRDNIDAILLRGTSYDLQHYIELDEPCHWTVDQLLFTPAFDWSTRLFMLHQMLPSLDPNRPRSPCDSQIVQRTVAMNGPRQPGEICCQLHWALYFGSPSFAERALEVPLDVMDCYGYSGWYNLTFIQRHPDRAWFKIQILRARREDFPHGLPLGL